jgi:hypothetical protein
MPQAPVTTVEAYLHQLPSDRRAAISAVRQVILKNLPKGYEETINWGMISYQIPLERYPNTYNGQPLCYASLASQKNHMALYLMCVYGSKELKAWFGEEFRKAGKKLDMGKSCVRFKKLEDLPLSVIGKAIKKVPAKTYIAHYEASRHAQAKADH